MCIRDSAKAGEITHNPSAREMDMLLASGEQISIALLAMALNELGCHGDQVIGCLLYTSSRSYSKETILEAYLNTISFTGTIQGVQTAAVVYKRQAQCRASCLKIFVMVRFSLRVNVARGIFRKNGIHQRAAQRVHLGYLLRL